MFKTKHCTEFILFFDVTRNRLALKQIIFLENVCCINLLLPLRLVSVLLEIHMQPFPLTYQTFAMLMLQFDLFPPSLKLPLLLSFLFLLIKSVHLLLLLGLLALLILHVSSPLVTTLSISSQKNSGRASSFLFTFQNCG